MPIWIFRSTSLAGGWQAVWDGGWDTPQKVLWEMQTDCKTRTLYLIWSATQRNWGRRELVSFRFPRISLSFNIKVHNNHHILNGSIEINVWKTSPEIKKKGVESGSKVRSSLTKENWTSYNRQARGTFGKNSFSFEKYL